METETDKYIRDLKEKGIKFRTVTAICPEHTGNYKQKVRITKDKVRFDCCYCVYIKQSEEVKQKAMQTEARHSSQA